MRATSLTAIADEEGTDKGTVSPAGLAIAGHNYTDVYDACLSGLRERPIALLEIGLGVSGPAWKAELATGRNAEGGASMRMWYRYLPRARIFGIDVNPAKFLDNDRTTTAVVDQGDPDRLREFVAETGVERFDVIVDDGSHRPDHQQVSLSTLFPYLAPEGLYFIEDLADNGLGDGRVDRYSADHVVNTRRLLRAFVEDGGFPEPNALLEPAALAAAIDSISFYCPQLRGERPRGLRALLGRRPPTVRFRSGQEELCVIRKAAGAC
jgi:hypothetical protein